MTNANPFAQRSTLEYELPPFAQIKEEHYLPAFYEGCAEQLAEVQAILDTPGAADDPYQTGGFVNLLLLPLFYSL
jgi:peptidyl-dipeptidase Dcp